MPGSSKWLFPSAFPIKTPYTPLLSPIRATCPTYLIILHLITWTILGEEYWSISSSLRSFLHSPVTSFLLGPNILNTLFSNTLSLRSSLKCERPIFFTPIHNRQNYRSVYLNLYIFEQQTGRQKILYWMTANIPLLQYALTFFLNRIYELFLPFKGTIINPYTVISSCILISRHDHIT